MKRFLLILSLFAITATAQAQLSRFITDWDAQVSVSPYSIQAFGRTPATAKLTASYGMIEFVMFHSFKMLYDRKGLAENSHSAYAGMGRAMDEGKQISDYRYGGNYFGIFVNPIQYHFWKLSVSGGIGWMFRKLPDSRGRHLQFQFRFTYMMKKWIGVSYQHVSSGFHIFDQANPGVDNVSIVINFLNNQR